MDDRDARALEFFRALVRIPTTSHLGPSSGSYAAAVTLLEKEAKQRGFATRVVEEVPGKPVLIATRVGLEPALPSLLLNSHYDVVPAEASLWKMAPPFAGDVVDGFVVGRGTQDMKCVCVQHLEALSRCPQLRRTVHVTFVPDEEIGGSGGMAKFVEAGHIRELNVGCALDEGLANPSPGHVTVFYGERAIFWIRVRATGNVGHGSRFVKGQAVMKLLETVQKFLAFRAEQEAKFEGHGCHHGVAHKLGDLVTLNCTMLNAGVTSDAGKTYALNVIPSTAEAGFDIRIPPSFALDEMERLLKSWCDPNEISIEFVEKVPEHNVSDISDKSPWWKELVATFKDLKIEIVPEVFPAGTDSRYLRGAGIPAFGFSPMSGTPILLHDNDERLGVETFIQGIKTFESLISRLANLN
jgi:aminoacylase